MRPCPGECMHSPRGPAHVQVRGWRMRQRNDRPHAAGHGAAHVRPRWSAHVPTRTTQSITSAAPPVPVRRGMPRPRASGAPDEIPAAVAGAGAVRPRSGGRSRRARRGRARRGGSRERSSPRRSPSARRASTVVCSACSALAPLCFVALSRLDGPGGPAEPSKHRTRPRSRGSPRTFPQIADKTISTRLVQALVTIP